MAPELQSMLDRADELLRGLEDEYKNCLQARNVTERAKNSPCSTVNFISSNSLILPKVKTIFCKSMYATSRKYLLSQPEPPDITDRLLFFQQFVELVMAVGVPRGGRPSR